MRGRTGKIAINKNLLTRQLSPEMPSPVKPLKTKVYIDDDDDDENIENQEPITDTSNEFNPVTVLLANGQPLLTNFEEKYLIDSILKNPGKDFEKSLQEKIQTILQMNYTNTQTSVFALSSIWIYDFLLKHFQTLITHPNSSEFFEHILKKSIEKNNSTLAFKHWQLQVLVNEYKNNCQQLNYGPKRRMTVRHIELK